MHQQFALDRSAAYLRFAWTTDPERPNRYLKVKVSNQLKWRFQLFKSRKNQNSTKNDFNIEPKSTKKKSIRQVFSEEVKGLSASDRSRNFGSSSFNANSYIETAGLFTLLKELGQLGFAEAADLALEEL